MVQDLIDQHIVIECPDPKFLAGLFLRPKPDSKFRLIIDLSPLNNHIHKEHFKMENLQQALDLLEQGYYMTKVDLKNAYYSIPITQEHQPYLAFLWKDKVWMFTRMCFGLSPAPRIFTKVMKPLLANMRPLYRRSLAGEQRQEPVQTINISTDNTLGRVGVHSQSREERDGTSTVHNIPRNGHMLDQHDGITPSPKRDSLISCIKQMLSRRQTSTFEMMSLLGRLEAIKPAFSMTPLYCRRLQRWSIAHLTNRSPSHEPLPLETDQLEELQFWATILPSLQPQPIITYQGSAVRFQTDASLTGWGSKWMTRWITVVGHQRSRNSTSIP